MTVIRVAVATTKFVLGIYSCTVDSDIGLGNFSLLGILCGHAYMQSHMSIGMDCYLSIIYLMSSGKFCH